MKIIPEIMTYENFKSYGCMLGHPGAQLPDISADDLDYWKRPMNLDNFEGNGEFSFMKVKRREAAVTKLDMLPESAELYLSLDGRASVYFVALPKNESYSAPDLATVHAYIYSGPGGVLINPGIWHWTPFPLSHDAEFFLGLRNNVLLEKEGGLVQGENQVIYCNLDEKLEVIL